MPWCVSLVQLSIPDNQWMDDSKPILVSIDSSVVVGWYYVQFVKCDPCMKGRYIGVPNIQVIRIDFFYSLFPGEN